MIIYDNTKAEVADLNITDESYRYRKVRGENTLNLYFSTFVKNGVQRFDFIEIPIGSTVEYDNEVYTLESPEGFKKTHTADYEYTLILNGVEAKPSKFKCKNMVDGRLKFTMTARPQEFMQMFCDNMNARRKDSYSNWIVGECLDASEKQLSFNHNYIDACVDMVADEFETEWEIEKSIDEFTFITTYTFSLRKVEYNKETPLALSYGKGNGFKPGVGRENFDSSKVVEVLFVQGGEKNIVASEYGSPTLLLPLSTAVAYDGVTFYYDGDVIPVGARKYTTDVDGVSLKRSDRPLSTYNEDSLDCSDLYPQRVGVVSSIEIDADGNFDFFDDMIPDGLDYSLCRIAGEKVTVIFQSGMLAGREFDLVQSDAVMNGYVHYERRFKIVSAVLDGVLMPSPTFTIAFDDTYAVFGTKVPAAYVCDVASHTGASFDMLREAVKYLYEHETARFSFSGELDGIWASQDWVNRGGMIRIGGYVRFSDTQFLPDGEDIRIIGVKDFPNRPHYPEIELSNNTAGGSVLTELNKRAADEVQTDTNFRKTVQFTKRRFRDTQETLAMLEGAVDNFSGAINPVIVRTMAMLVGDESLQFRFINNVVSPTEIGDGIQYESLTKKLSVVSPEQGNQGGIIQHMTIGIESISETHLAAEFKFWEMAVYESASLNDPTKKYYLYAGLSKSSTSGEFELSESTMPFNTDPDFYYLLVGILNSEYDGTRSFVSMYGYTEVMPGRLTTGKIVSSDGQTFIDLVNGMIQGVFTFKAGSTGIDKFDEWALISAAIQEGVSAKGLAEALDYLKVAIADGSTDIAGGLLLTNLLLMKSGVNITGGFSGDAADNVGIWTGGSYQDAIDNIAKLILRKDGSARFADGNAIFGSDGSVSIEGILKVLSGGVIGNFTIEDGAIIGRDANGLIRTRLSTNTIEAISNLAGGWSSVSEPLIGVWNGQNYNLRDEGIVSGGSGVVNGSFTIPYASKVRVLNGQSGVYFSNPAAVSGSSVSDFVEIFKNGVRVGYGTTDQEITLTTSGYHTVKLTQSFESTIIEGTYTDYELTTGDNGRGVEFQGSVEQVEIGTNGFYCIFSSTSYVYYKADFGFEARFGQFLFRVGKNLSGVDGIWKSINGGTSFSTL